MGGPSTLPKFPTSHPTSNSSYTSSSTSTPTHLTPLANSHDTSSSHSAATSPHDTSHAATSPRASPHITPPFPPQEPLLKAIPPKASWVNLFKENRKLENGFSLRKCDTTRPLILHEDCVQTQEEAWGIVLIGLIVGKFPGLEAFNEVRQSWNVSSLYKFHSSGWILFKFDNEVDRDHVLANGPYATFGAPWMLKKMPLDFTFDDDYFTSVPTWIKLPNLPLEVWNPDALSQITSFVGTPLNSDQCTKDKSRHEYARVLVEVDTTQPLVHEVHFQMPRSKKWIAQPVVYESEPKFCMKCKRLGHGTDTCTGKKPPRRGRSRSRPARSENVAPNEGRPLMTAVHPVKTAVISPTQQAENVEKSLMAAVQSTKTAVMSPKTAVISSTTAVNSRQQFQIPSMTAVISSKTAVTSDQQGTLAEMISNKATEVLNNIQDISLAKKSSQLKVLEYNPDIQGYTTGDKEEETCEETSSSEDGFPTDGYLSEEDLQLQLKEFKEEAKKRQRQRLAAKKQQECVKPTNTGKKQQESAKPTTTGAKPTNTGKKQQASAQPTNTSKKQRAKANAVEDVASFYEDMASDHEWQVVTTKGRKGKKTNQ